MSDYILEMKEISKEFSGIKALADVNFKVGKNEIHCLIGENGAGKTTVLRIMAGLDTDFSGEAWAAEGAKVGYLPQEPQLDESLNVRENVMLGVAAKTAKLERYNELAMNYSDETADEMAALAKRLRGD